MRTIYLFIFFVYLFCVVIKYIIRVYGDKVNSASIVRAPTFTLDDVWDESFITSWGGGRLYSEGVGIVLVMYWGGGGLKIK